MNLGLNWNRLLRRNPKVIPFTIYSFEMALLACLARMIFNLFIVSPSDLTSMVVENYLEEFAPVSNQEIIEYVAITSFDPFYRENIIKQINSMKPWGDGKSMLKLFGTRVGYHGGSAAIIDVGGGGQKLFYVGDEIYQGMKLVAVFQNNVEIETTAERKLLFLHEHQFGHDETSLAERALD